MAGPRFDVRFSGLEEFLARVKRRERDVVRAAEGALFVEGEETITAAKLLTPVDEGNLRSSGHVQLPVVGPNGVTVEIGFGGPAGSGNHGGDSNPEDVGYAVPVHEDLTAHHDVGQAKYLEAPLTQRRPGFEARLVRRMRRRLRARP